MKLTHSEMKLVRSAASGHMLDLVPDFPTSHTVDQEEMRSWKKNHEIRSEIIRDIMTGRLAPAAGFSPHGLRLRGAHIVGEVDIENLESTIPLELIACYIPDGINARNCSLPNVTIAFGIVGRCDRKLVQGALDLTNAEITNDCVLTGTKIINGGGPALAGENLVVKGNMELTSPFHAEGSGEMGAVRLVGARIGSRLNFSGAYLANPDGPALRAGALSTGSGLYLREGFTAKGYGQDGSIRLARANIGGRVSMSQSSVSNPNGPALNAPGIIVGLDLRLHDGFKAYGEGPSGAVQLSGARIQGRASFRGSILKNNSGPSLVANEIHIDNDLYLDGSFCQSATCDAGSVFLRNAMVGALHVSSEVIDAAVNASCLNQIDRHSRNAGMSPRESRNSSNWCIDGLTYEGIPTEKAADWLKLIRRGTSVYTAQPYQRLAEVLRNMGHDAEARMVLIAQRKDHLWRGQPGVLAKIWGWLTYITVGFGYRSWLPLCWLGLLFGLAYLAVFVAWPDGLATVLSMTKENLEPQCVPIEKIQVTVEMIIPFLATGVEKMCQINSRNSDGMWLASFAIAIRALSWTLFTLFVAGFTGIIRRN